jgi:hypothetical protein
MCIYYSSDNEIYFHTCAIWLNARRLLLFNKLSFFLFCILIFQFVTLFFVLVELCEEGYILCELRGERYFLIISHFCGTLLHTSRWSFIRLK